jgi:hypothetical protein
MCIRLSPTGERRRIYRHLRLERSPGHPRGEVAALRAAHHLEGLLGVAQQLPIDPRILG